MSSTGNVFVYVFGIGKKVGQMTPAETDRTVKTLAFYGVHPVSGGVAIVKMPNGVKFDLTAIIAILGRLLRQDEARDSKGRFTA